MSNSKQVSEVFKSTVLTGEAPIQVQSATVCTNLNADLLDGYESSYFINKISSISAANILMQQGSIPCNTINTVYTIQHNLIDPSLTVPVISLSTPSSASSIFVVGTTNRQPSSFDVVISDAPSMSGYYINWHMGQTIINTNTILTSANFNSLDLNIVHKTTNESISGEKTFYNSLIVKNNNIISNPISASSFNVLSVDISGKLTDTSLSVSSLFLPRPVYIDTLINNPNIILNFLNSQTIGILNGLTSTCSFTTSNLSPGKIYGLRVKASADQTIVFPNFIWLSTPPTTITANKWLIVTMESLTTSDSDVFADWKIQA